MHHFWRSIEHLIVPGKIFDYLGSVYLDLPEIRGSKVSWKKFSDFRGAAKIVESYGLGYYLGGG